MADDVTYTVAANATPPGGTKATTDETTSGPHSVGSHMGIAKLAVSADGDSTHVPATVADGLLVDLGANNDVTVTGTVVVGPSVTPGTAAAHLGKAEQSAHVNGDVGVMALGVRNDANTPLAPDGSYVPLQVESDGLKTRSRLLILDAAGVPTAVGIGAGGVPIPVSDDGGSITVDGPVTDVELRATPVPVSGTVAAVKDLGATATRTQVADNAADVLILAANAVRFSFSVFNDSTATLYLALGAAAATTTNYTSQVPPNSFFSDDTYAGEVRGIWATDPGTGAARVTEVS